MKVEFSDKEKMYFKEKLELDKEYPMPKNFLKIKFYWNDKLDEAECNAQFRWYRWNEISFPMSLRKEEKLPRLVATVAHELIHRNDFFSNPLIYMLFFALLRSRFEELPEAWERKYNILMEIPENQWL